MVASSKTIRVLVVGRTPPPYLGAPIMLDFLLRSPMPGLDVRHLQLNLSSDGEPGGRFGWAKLVRLFCLIVRVLFERVTFRPMVLYYTPELAKPRSTVLRDAAILAATRWCFPKTVLHLHSSGHQAVYDSLSAWQRWLVRKGFFHADGVIRLSRLTPDDAAFLQARREYIIPNGVADPFAEREREGCRTGETTQPLRILFVSLLCEGKGLLVLLDACGRLAKRGVPFHLNLMGPMESIEFAHRVQARITELQIDDRVSLLGIRTGAEKFADFAASDVLCHPTFFDTFPLVLLEAMSAGLPVVATHHSGIPDIVDEGETGFLVAPRDSAAVADRLAQLASNPQMRAEFGLAGRRRYLSEFTLERHVEQVREALLDVCGIANVIQEPCSHEALLEVEAPVCELETV